MKGVTAAVVGLSADILSSAQSMSGVTEDYNVSAGTAHRMIAGHLSVTSAGTVDVQTSTTGNRAVAELLQRVAEDRVRAAVKTGSNAEPREPQDRD